MKKISDLAKNFFEKIDDPKLIDAIQDGSSMKYLEVPMMSNELTCPVCHGTNGKICLIDPQASNKRMWFCAEADCLAMVPRSLPKQYGGSLKSNRAILWPLFCEINNIGDIYHDVRFEKIEQVPSKIECLRKFCDKTEGIIMMEGRRTGTEKTYCVLAFCELFTRKNSSCLFFSQDNLIAKWLDSLKSDRPMLFRDNISKVSILVVDDFGSKAPPDGFLQFLMEILNIRMSWTNRGTIITTCLKHNELSKFCGDALIDRLNTGYVFSFNGKTRRKQKTL